MRALNEMPIPVLFVETGFLNLKDYLQASNISSLDDQVKLVHDLLLYYAKFDLVSRRMASLGQVFQRGYSWEVVGIAGLHRDWSDPSSLSWKRS